MKNNIIKVIILIILALMIIGVYYLKQSTKTGQISTSDTDLEGKKAAKMINFVAPNCMACEKMEGLMKEIISEYEGKASIMQIDIMEEKEWAQEYNIIYTPTQIFFDENGNEIYRHEGFIGKKDLIQKLASMGVEK